MPPRNMFPDMARTWIPKRLFIRAPGHPGYKHPFCIAVLPYAPPTQIPRHLTALPAREDD